METKDSIGIEDVRKAPLPEKNVQENKPEKTESKKKEKVPSPKKELSLQEKKKRSMLLFIPCISLVFLICMYWIFKPSQSQELDENVAGFNVDIPLPKDDGLISDKKKAYEMEQLTQKQSNRMQSLQDIALELDSLKNGTESPPTLNADLETVSQTPSAIRQSTTAYRDMNRELSSFYQPTKDAKTQELEEKIDELSKRLETAESGKSESEKQLEMMEKSYQMASKYITPMVNGENGQTENASNVSSKNKKSNIAPVSAVKERTITGLQQVVSDSAFIAQYSKPRNMGFNTAIGNSIQMSKNTIKACIHENQTLTNGQTVCLRLLEPLLAGTFIIPQNTLVSGIAGLQGERLNVSITGIEYEGNIIPVELLVYDTDGLSGINIPGSMEMNAAKEAAANIGAGMGNSFSFAQSAGQQIAMDLTRGAMQAGSQYISKKFREVKVNLKAGYEVMLLAKQQ